MLNSNTFILEYCSVRLRSNCETDLGRSIKIMATDNIQSVGVVKPVYGIPTFQLTGKAV